MSIEYYPPEAGYEYERIHPAAFIAIGVALALLPALLVTWLWPHPQPAKIPTVNATCVAEVRYAT